MKNLLASRHIIMIALGSAIGTGLFFGLGLSLQIAGPSILITYAAVGAVMYFVVRALGEMAIHEPNTGSFSYYANKYIGQRAGFLIGWNYWFNYIIVCMLELTAAATFMDYWFPKSVHWVVVTIIFILLGITNLMNVRWFGEIEFWLAGIKVLAILLIISLGCYLIFFDKEVSPSSLINAKEMLHRGLFIQGYKSFLFSFATVIFSFGGIELIGIAAGESNEPYRSLPKAINGIIIRIVGFYLLTILIILCLYPWGRINAQISPFIDVFRKVGVGEAASVIAFVAFTAALSSFNSGIYTTSRMLASLASHGHAPSFLAYKNKSNNPALAVGFTLTCVGVVIILNYTFPQHILAVLLSIAAVAAILNWISIMITHFYFRKAVAADQLSYKALFYPFSSIVVIGFFIALIILFIFMPLMRLAIFIAPLWIGILWVAYSIKSRLLKPSRNTLNT